MIINNNLKFIFAVKQNSIHKDEDNEIVFIDRKALIFSSVEDAVKFFNEENMEPHILVEATLDVSDACQLRTLVDAALNSGSSLTQRLQFVVLNKRLI